MVFKAVCNVDDVWEGELQEFEIDNREVIVVHTEGQGFRVFDAKCPHQDQSLGEAELDGSILTCPAHLWQFDVTTGEGVNPTGCKLVSYPCKVIDEQLMVDVHASVETSK